MTVLELTDKLNNTEDIEEKRELFLTEISSLNGQDYNFRKLAEEATEVAGEVLKYLNKKEGYRPTKEDILKELSDLGIRIFLAFPELEEDGSYCDNLMKEYSENKIDKLIKYFLEFKHAKI